MKILTSQQMRNIDRRATDRFGIPSIVLMENAALAVVDVIAERYPSIDRVAIFCGPGQNGGDGFAIARHLENRGVVPLVIVVGDRARIKGDAETNLRICEALALPIVDVARVDDVETVLARASDADLIVDAIFGTGLSRAPEALFAEVIRGLPELRTPIVAVDVPSGICAETATPFEPSIRAEVTVTFAAPKVCHVFDPAASWCGEIVVADISIPDIAIDEEPCELAITTQHEVMPLFEPRMPTVHKGTMGHVAVIGGSPGRSGAAILAARGAIRTGAGLVTVVTDSDTARLVHAGSIESMTASAIDVAAVIGTKDAVVLGPGLADDEESYARVRELAGSIDRPHVIDASGLNAFAGKPELLRTTAPRVITPHPGELARLIGSDTASISADRISAARNAARSTGCVVVLKGHQSLIASPDGQVNVNPTGNPGMASGGMGDVLAGVIGALLARGVDPFEASCAGTYLHGFAGDLLRDEMGDAGLTASDLAERLPIAMRKLSTISA